MRMQVNTILRKKQYRYDLLYAKEASWRMFVSSEGNENPWGRVYKFVRGKHSNTPIPAVRDEIGNLTTSRADSLRVLLESFFPSKPTDELPVATVPAAAGEPIENEEIDVAVHRLRRDKAPGPDGFTASIVRHVWYAVPEVLQQLFERCRLESTFPIVWKISRLVILLKSPEKDQTDKRSFRPICLLSVLGKTLERVMVNRLTQNAPEHPDQYGFTAGRGTEDAFLRVAEETQAPGEKYLLGIFIDFRGAFDNLRWDQVLHKISTLDEGSSLWHSYFRGRVVSISNGDTLVQREVQRGCPQGSICGPAVWNLMIADLLTILSNSNIKAVAYADDLILLIPGMTRNQLEKAACKSMQLVDEWGKIVGVPINEQKTKHMLLRGILASSRPPTVHLGNFSIIGANTVKYLGVTIGPGLSYRPHFKALKTKLMKLTGAFRRVTRKEWGLTRRTVLTIYRGLFVPVMSYACLIWADSVLRDPDRKLLIQAQRQALYVALPFCRTISTVAMQVLAGQMPWDLEARRLAVMAKLRRGIVLQSTDLVQSDHLIGLSRKKCTEVVMDAFLDEWQRRWDADEHGRVMYEWIRKVRYCKEHPFFSPSMELMFLLTGYGSLNATLSTRTNSVASPLCPTCNQADENWRHVLLRCPTYTHIRKLNDWRIKVEVDGTADVQHALLDRDSFHAINKFAQAAFKIRKTILLTQIDG